SKSTKPMHPPARSTGAQDSAKPDGAQAIIRNLSVSLSPRLSCVVNCRDRPRAVQESVIGGENIKHRLRRGNQSPQAWKSKVGFLSSADGRIFLCARGSNSLTSGRSP